MLNDPNSLDNRDPRFIKKVTTILDSTLAPYHRTEVRGLSRIPRNDGVIYVGNHNGYPYMADAWLVTNAIFNEYGMSRYPYILMHELPLRLPLLNQLFTRMGCIRASGECATQVLDRGLPLLIYPGADVELMRPHRDRTRVRFNGRTSHVRFAMKYKVPIVPVVAVGSHSTAMILDDLPWVAQAIGVKSKLGINAWPLMLSIPWGLTLGPFIPPYIPWPSKIIIELLEPMEWTPQGAGPDSSSRIRECAAQLEQAIESALVRLEAERLTHERPPVEMLRDAFTKAIAWLDANFEDFIHAFTSIGAQWLRTNGSAVAAAASSKFANAASKVSADVQHDVNILREMLGRSNGNSVAVPVAVPVAAPQKAITPEQVTPKAISPEQVTVEQTANMVQATAKSRFTERQIQEILKQAERGKSVSVLCRERGISASTFYRWRSRYAMEAANP